MSFDAEQIIEKEELVTTDNFSLNRQTLPEQVAQKIESMILADVDKFAGKLPSEQSLATAFSVSRTVIREALVILRAKGLIIKTNGTNARINTRPDISLENTLKLMLRLKTTSPQEIYEVRCALETAAVTLAACRHNECDFAALEEVVDKLEQVHDDFKLRAELDMAFHRMIINMSGNAQLVAIADPLFELLKPLVQEVLACVGMTTDAVEMHRRVISAVKAGNADEAADQMRIHLALFVRNMELREQNK